jgi:hypothetical protein
MAGKDSTFDYPGTPERRCPGLAEALCFVAGERLVLSGKNQFPDFLSEIDDSDWKTSMFFYNRKSSCQIRVLDPSTTGMQSGDFNRSIAGIALITEILLD